MNAMKVTHPDKSSHLNENCELSAIIRPFIFITDRSIAYTSHTLEYHFAKQMQLRKHILFTTVHNMYN